MAKVKDPILFSKYFGIDPETIASAGLIDPFINVDTQLFIDPVLLEKSGEPCIATAAIGRFRSHFENSVRLLAISKKEGDAAWRGAWRLLDLEEPPENGLGYGGSGRSGSSRPDEVRAAIMRTASEIIELGSSDPEMISLMGFFEEDVGPDTISDFTTRVIAPELAEVTAAFCKAHGIPVHEIADFPNAELPMIIDRKRRRRHFMLVPRDIVRDLPIANDWSGIERAVAQNARIRDRVNRLLGSIAKPTIADRKHALRQIALSSSENFEEFLAAVKEHSANYDPNLDALAYYKLKGILVGDLGAFKSASQFDLSDGPVKLRELVLETVSMFRHHVENGNLWEELWISGKPKKERASQLIYYAIADCFCRANNVDISPETDMGGGLIDFKFSRGYNARVLVEIKKSTGTVVHGYEKQLEIYKDASRTNFGVFVVINVGGLGSKLVKIKKIRQDRLDAGEPASDIVVVDAMPKASASKRN